MSVGMFHVGTVDVIEAYDFGDTQHDMIYYPPPVWPPWGSWAISAYHPLGPLNTLSHVPSLTN